MVKSKEKKKSKTPSKVWEFYKDGKPSRKYCPKCGEGFYLAQHKNPDRLVCGNCQFVEFSKIN